MSRVTIQKVEIVVTSNQDPGHVARAVMAEIESLGRRPPTPPSQAERKRESDPDLLAALELAEKHGVRFIAHFGGQSIDAAGLSPGEVKRLIDFGPDDFWPHKLNMTQENWQALRNWSAKCTGTNAVGEPCGAWIDPYPDLPFVDGQTNRCRHHKEPRP